MTFISPTAAGHGRAAARTVHPLVRPTSDVSFIGEKVNEVFDLSEDLIKRQHRYETKTGPEQLE